jgi:hypothetical protein
MRILTVAQETASILWSEAAITRPNFLLFHKHIGRGVGLGMEVSLPRANALETAALCLDAQYRCRSGHRPGFRGFRYGELQPGNVLGRFSRRLAREFADNMRSVGELPGGADEMASDGLTILQQGCNRFAERPLQRAAGVSGAGVNLGPCRLKVRDDGCTLDGDRFWKIVKPQSMCGGDGRPD